MSGKLSDENRKSHGKIANQRTANKKMQQTIAADFHVRQEE
jgi:hypothetical protein